MFSIGLLSLSQITFFPGFIILSLLKVHKGIIKTSVLSLSLSLIFNYLLVYILVLLHLYIFPIVALIFATEIIYFIHLVNLHYRNYQKINQIDELKKFIMSSSGPRLFLLLLALMPIFFIIIFYFLAERNTIFIISDAVLRWNMWATVWFHGSIPATHWNYPQLLPANWSLTYLFMNLDYVQLFAKLTIFLFPIAIVFTFLDLTVRTRKFAYVWSIFFLSILWFVILRSALFNGYADVACSFFAVVSVYCLLLVTYDTDHINKYILIGLVACAGAALTKQAGIYLACIYPFLLYFLVLKENKHNKKIFSHWFVYSIAILILLIVPGYLHSHLPPAMRSFSKHDVILSALPYYSLSIIHRMIFGLSVLSKVISSYSVCILFVFILAGLILKEKLIRILTALFVIPYFIIWLCFFSYDVRNLAFLFPFIALIIGFCIENILQWYVRLIKVSKYLNLMIILAGLVIFFTVLGVNTKKINFMLFKQQGTAKLKFVGDPILNKILFMYFHNKDTKFTIISNSPFLSTLPTFENNSLYSVFMYQDKWLPMIKNKKPVYILIDKYLLVEGLRDLFLKVNHMVTIQDVKNEYNHAIDQSSIKAYKVDEFLQKNILNNGYIKAHSKVIYNTPDLLFLKMHY